MSPTKKSPAEQAAQRRYMAQKATIQVVTTPEHREAIKAHAEARGESVNSFIKRAIDEAMERDNAAQSGDT